MLYCNPNTRPKSVEDYKWNINEWNNGVLTLTHKEIKDLGEDLNKLYILVKSVFHASYSLTISETNAFNKEIKAGNVEIGYADAGEHINYLLTVEALKNHNNLTVTLNSESATHSNLYIRSCDEKEDCFVSGKTMEALKSGE